MAHKLTLSLVKNSIYIIISHRGGGYHDQLPFGGTGSVQEFAGVYIDHKQNVWDCHKKSVCRKDCLCLVSN